MGRVGPCHRVRDTESNAMSEATAPPIFFQPGATDLRGRHRNQRNHFDRRYLLRGTRTRRWAHGRDLQDAELQAPCKRNDDPRPGLRRRATASATGDAGRRVRRKGPCGPGGARHQDGARVQSATASDGQSQRSSHLPRPTGRTEASGGQVRYCHAAARNAPARWMTVPLVNRRAESSRPMTCHPRQDSRPPASPRPPRPGP